MGTLFRSVVVVGAALLAGCSAALASIAESDFRGGLPAEAVTAEPGSWAHDPSFPKPVPVAGWLESGAKFAVVISGSSSCPAFPSALEVIDSRHVKLGLETKGSQACTADMAPRTYIIRTPGDVDISQEVTLEFGGTTAVLPPL